MNLIGVIGIGSPFGADNIGQGIIQLLKQNLGTNDFKNQIQLEYYDRPGIYLLELIKNFKVVHIIDAIVSGQPLGTIHRYEDRVIFQEDRLLSSHAFGVVEVLTLGKVPRSLPENFIIHGIEIHNNKFANIFSDELNNACSELVSRIIKELMSTYTQ